MYMSPPASLKKDQEKKNSGKEVNSPGVNSTEIQQKVTSLISLLLPSEFNPQLLDTNTGTGVLIISRPTEMSLKDYAEKLLMLSERIDQVGTQIKFSVRLEPFITLLIAEPLSSKQEKSHTN